VARIDGIRLKIKWAKKHISNLDAAIRSFCDSEPYTLGVEEKPTISHIALKVARVQPIPTDFALIIGDAVHNLRSSLDHLAWQLVEAGGGSPNKDTYFPICYGPQGCQQYASAIGKGEIDKMRPGAEKLLRSVQPYVSGDNTLWHIHELDRWDKHRLILTVVTTLNDWRIVFGPGREIAFPETPVPLEAGYEIVNIPTSTYRRETHEDFKLGLDIAFGQSEIVAGKPVLETLNGMADFVGSIVTQFERFMV